MEEEELGRGGGDGKERMSGCIILITFWLIMLRVLRVLRILRAKYALQYDSLLYNLEKDITS